MQDIIIVYKDGDKRTTFSLNGTCSAEETRFEGGRIILFRGDGWYIKRTNRDFESGLVSDFRSADCAMPARVF